MHNHKPLNAVASPAHMTMLGHTLLEGGVLFGIALGVIISQQYYHSSNML